MAFSINVLLTAAQRKVIADLLPKLADRLNLDEKNFRTIFFTTKEIESIQQVRGRSFPCQERHDPKLVTPYRRYRYEGP